MIKTLFAEAETLRTHETKEMSLLDLCNLMAEKAGWHTVYVPNNRSKVKDCVRYHHKFDDSLICELLCRFKGKIIQQFLLTKGLYRDSAPSKIYDCVFRFMSTYKPSMVTRDSQIVNRLLLSIKQRAIECNYEEHTAYYYTRKLDSSNKPVLNEKGNYEMFPHLSSLSQPIHMKNDSTPTTLESLIEDTSIEAKLSYSYELSELEETYTSSEKQKILLNILVSEGALMTPVKLYKEYFAETGDTSLTKKEVVLFFENLKKKLAATVR